MEANPELEWGFRLKTKRVSEADVQLSWTEISVRRLKHKPPEGRQGGRVVRGRGRETWERMERRERRERMERREEEEGEEEGEEEEEEEGEEEVEEGRGGRAQIECHVLTPHF
jgi:hypothetical protein